MTPALARAVLLALVIGYVGVLSAALVVHGARGVARRRIARSVGRGTSHLGRAAVLHGAIRVVAGLCGLALAGWLLA